MQIKLTFMEIESRTASGFVTSSTTLFANRVPSRTVEASNLAEARAALADYVGSIELPGIVYVAKAGKGRAFPGFGAFSIVSNRINFEKAPLV